jgi:hypothetical protein
MPLHPETHGFAMLRYVSEWYVSGRWPCMQTHLEPYIRYCGAKRKLDRGMLS